MNALIALSMVVAVFLTALLSGIFGMAGGLILLWILFFLLPVGTAIAVHGVIQFVSNGSRAWFSRGYIDWRIVGIISVGLVLAALFFLLVSYSPDLAVVSIVIGLLPILVWIPNSWFALDASRPHHAVACGLIAGGLSIGVGVSGPTIDIFFIRTMMDRRVIIATKAAVQVVSHGIKVAFYAGSTLVLTGSEWLAIAVAAPIAILGTKAGNSILQRLTDANFRSWTRWIVTAIGVFYFARGIHLLAS